MEQPIKFNAEQKWEFLFGTMIIKVLAPLGLEKKGQEAQGKILEACREAINCHREYKTDLKAKIQMMIAQERAKTILDVSRATRIKVLEQVFTLVDELQPTRVREMPKDEEKPKIVSPDEFPKPTLLK